MREVIGITGRAGSGKDTAASIIKSYFEHKNIYAKRYSLADPLKKICSELFKVPLDDFYDRDAKYKMHPIWKMTPRDMMTTIGTDVMRDGFRDNVWITRAQLEIDSMRDDAVIIIPDIRFDNEAKFIKDNGGIIIETVRPESYIDENDKYVAHKSESGIQNFNTLVIGNDGTLEEFSHKIISILDHLII